MRLRQRWCDGHRLLRILTRFRPGGFALAAEISDQRPRFGTLGISQGIIGIQPDCLIEVSYRFAKVFEIASLEMIMTEQISIVRFCIFRRWLGG